VPEHPQTNDKKGAVEQNPEDPAVKLEEGACRKKRYQREHQKLDYDCYNYFWIDSAHLLYTFYVAYCLSLARWHIISRLKRSITP